MVVLNKQIENAQFRELRLVIRLHKKTACIAEHLGTKFPDTGKRRFYSLQGSCDLDGLGDCQLKRPNYLTKLLGQAASAQRQTDGGDPAGAIACREEPRFS